VRNLLGKFGFWHYAIASPSGDASTKRRPFFFRSVKIDQRIRQVRRAERLDKVAIQIIDRRVVDQNPSLSLDKSPELATKSRSRKDWRAMTYRRQLFLLLLALVVVSTGLFAGASYRICDRLLRHEVHRKVHSIAATTAMFLNPAIVAQLGQPGDGATPQYEQLEHTLRAVRDANRRKDVNVDHVFILVPSREHTRDVVYGVDTGEESGITHRPGDPFEEDGWNAQAGLEGIHRLDDQLRDFQIGYDTGFAPIFDRSGKLIAELGVKLGWAPATMLGNVWQYLLPPFVLTLTLALVISAVLSREVTGPLYSLRETVEAIGRGNLNAAAEPHGPVEFVEMAKAINLMTAGLRERKMIEQAFSGYLSREVLDRILRDGKLPELKGERRRVSLLFADIRDFTSMSEKRQPEDVVEMLSEFFACMVAVVRENYGYVDKFLGDGMMATFGAPADDPEHEKHAISAALEMQEELRKLSSKWKAQGRASFKMGIGINSGHAVIGNIGSEAHMEYTAIGDTVNLASRLQSATKEVHAEILVSGATFDVAQTAFRWAPLGEITVKGRSQPVRIYGVLGESSDVA
jgi:adenylate cyclase